MNKIKQFFGNRWVGFTLATILYTLWFVVWSQSLWMLLGIPFIFDIYITKYIYNFIGKRNQELCERSSIYKFVYEWVNAIVFATVVASIIHIYVFQMYVIPSSSMENTLLIGDYLYVSKLSYGPKMPNTPVAFPFVHHTMPFSTTKKSFSECVKWDYKRLKGIKPIRRNDVVVFNFPAGDTVLLEKQDVTYYDELRDYQQTYGQKEGREKLFSEYTVISRPVDKRENYIKRAVALPNDTLQIVEGRVWINGKPQEPIEGKLLTYIVETSQPLSAYTLEKLGITEYSAQGRTYYMILTDSAAEALKKMESVVAIRQYIFAANDDVFPHNINLGWSQDNYGPIWIPQAGATVDLTPENLPLYERIIDQYEDNDLEVIDGQIIINGKPVTSYTFKMDYYWMMGDNRHNSADSRFWGFVPIDHIVGKASFVWLSLDPAKSFPSNIRWNKLFTKIR